MLGVVVNCKKPVLDSPGYAEVRTARAGSNSLPPEPYQTPAFRHIPSGEMFPAHGLNSSLIASAISYLTSGEPKLSYSSRMIRRQQSTVTSVPVSVVVAERCYAGCLARSSALNTDVVLILLARVGELALVVQSAVNLMQRHRSSSQG